MIRLINATTNIWGTNPDGTADLVLQPGQTMEWPSAQNQTVVYAVVNGSPSEIIRPYSADTNFVMMGFWWGAGVAVTVIILKLIRRGFIGSSSPELLD